MRKILQKQYLWVRGSKRLKAAGSGNTLPQYLQNPKTKFPNDCLTFNKKAKMTKLLK